jgi:hypothetical protein
MTVQYIESCAVAALIAPELGRPVTLGGTVALGSRRPALRGFEQRGRSAGNEGARAAGLGRPPEGFARGAGSLAPRDWGACDGDLGVPVFDKRNTHIILTMP